MDESEKKSNVSAVVKSLESDYGDPLWYEARHAHLVVAARCTTVAKNLLAKMLNRRCCGSHTSESNETRSDYWQKHYAKHHRV